MANDRQPTVPKPAAAGVDQAALRSAADEIAAEVAAAEQEREREIDLLDQIRAELEEAKDRALRSQAELENYRKRIARDMDNQLRYADLPLVRDLLPVMDNISRTIDAAEKAHDLTALLDGLKMVQRQFELVLDQHHCTLIGALEQPFDPHRHEAVMQQPSDKFPPNTVVQVVEPGYQLHDRVVRPSRVIVSTAPPAGNTPS